MTTTYCTLTLIINSVLSIHCTVGWGSKDKANALKYGSTISGHAARALVVSSCTKGQLREPARESRKWRITGLLDLIIGEWMNENVTAIFTHSTHIIMYMYMQMYQSVPHKHPWAIIRFRPGWGLNRDILLDTAVWKLLLEMIILWYIHGIYPGVNTCPGHYRNGVTASKN